MATGTHAPTSGGFLFGSFIVPQKSAIDDRIHDRPVAPNHVILVVRARQINGLECVPLHLVCPLTSFGVRMRVRQRADTFNFSSLALRVTRPVVSRVRRWLMASHEFSPAAPEGAIPQWQLEYEAALNESDQKTLFKRIEVAEAAILARREILVQSPDGFAERQEIKAALDKLRRLKKEVLKF